MRTLKPSKRVFVPARRFVGHTTIETTVERWEWTRGKGIKTFYKDGLICKSAYRTLRELLAGENASEIEKHLELQPYLCRESA